MKFKNNFFQQYLYDAPLPLAIERSLECQILSTKNFEKPILDIGCGEGIFASKLFDEKIDLGIDPNNLELAKAKEYNAYIELINCCGDKIPKETGTYKTILSNSVMEHIPNIDQVLQEAHRLLCNNGTMYLTLPTNLFEQYTLAYQLLAKMGLKNLAQKYAKFFNKFWKHYHCYDYAKWKFLFEKNGFEVKNHINYASKKTCLLNDCLCPFSIIAYVSKKISNRWFISNSIRKFTADILHNLFKNIANFSQLEDGTSGLIFFELEKK